MNDLIDSLIHDRVIEEFCSPCLVFLFAGRKGLYPKSFHTGIKHPELMQQMLAFGYWENGAER